MTLKSHQRTINLCLLVTSIALVSSGFILQFNYHMGNHGQIITTDTFWGMDYYFWSMFHKVNSLLCSIIVFLHLYVNYKWIKGVITKHLVDKHKQVFIFSSIFFVCAITGFTAWYFSLEANELSRKLFIEIHDKITLFLFIFLILHIWKRRKRFL